MRKISGAAVKWRRSCVYYAKVLPVKHIDKPRRGINRKAAAANDKRIGASHFFPRTLPYVVVERLLIQNDVGLNHAAALARRHALCAEDIIEVIKLSAARAIISVDAPVQFINVFAARRLMQPVDILRQHRLDFAFLFKPCQRDMHGVRHGGRIYHILFVVIVKVFRAPREEGVRDNDFGRKSPLVFGVVNAVLPAEVRDVACGGYARAAEENGVIAVVDNFPECCHKTIVSPFPRRCNGKIFFYDSLFHKFR